eukprot:1385821-Alexandrium_andersonii.AAC.1
MHFVMYGALSRGHAEPERTHGVPRRPCHTGACSLLAPARSVATAKKTHACAGGCLLYTSPSPRD